MLKEEIPHKDILDAAFLTPNNKVLSDDKQSLLSALGNREGIPEPKRAYKFDNVDDYISYPSGCLDSIFNAGSNVPFEIEFSIKINSSETNQPVFVGGNPALEADESIIITLSSANLMNVIIRNSTSGASNKLVTTTTTTITNGEWYNIKISWDGTTSGASGITIYINDVLETTTDNSVGTVTLIRQQTTEPAFGRKGSKYIDCYLDYFKISKTGVGDILFYKCDESNGTIAYDSTGNGYHGTLTNISVATFHYEGVDIPSSFQNNYGCNQERQFFDGNDFSQTIYPNSATAQVQTLELTNTEGVILEYRSYAKTALTIGSIASNGSGGITVTISSHGRQEGEPISIAGTSNYNGGYNIFNVTTNTFDVDVSYVSNQSGSVYCEDYNTKYSGFYNDNDGNGNGIYFYQENKNVETIIQTYVPSTPIIAGAFEFVLQNSHDGTGALDTGLLTIRYTGIRDDVYSYLDGVTDINNLLVKVGGDRFTTSSVIDWYNDTGTTSGEQDSLNALLPFGATFLDIAEYNTASRGGTTSTLFGLTYTVSTEDATSRTRFSGDYFTENSSAASTGERAFFRDNNYEFPEVSEVQINVPRISGTATWTKVYTSQSFIEGQSLTPRNENDITKDVNGFELKNKGKIKQLAKITNVNIGVFDGVDDYVQMPQSLVGVTITSLGGTSTLSIDDVNDRIDGTAGNVYDVLLSDGTHLTFNEGVGLTVYDISGNGNHGTWTNVTDPTQWGKSDVAVNYLMINGCEIYDDDATHLEVIRIPFTSDGSRITPTISGYSKVGELQSIERTKELDNNYDSDINFQYYKALPDTLPSDYQASDVLPVAALVDNSTVGKEKKLLIANEDVSANQRLLTYTRN